MKVNSIINKTELFCLKIAAVNDPKLKELSSLPSFSAKVKFCEANFQKLKAGSGRIAYDYNAELVLKLAKNDKGIEQNKTEADGFIQQHYKDIVANVIDSDPNDIWLLSEKAFKVTPTEFKNLLGTSVDNLRNFLNKKFNSNNNFTIENEDQLNNNPIIEELMDLMANFSMPPGDICRISSWGKVRNRLVLIDYGLTNEIYNEFYK